MDISIAHGENNKDTVSRTIEADTPIRESDALESVEDADDMMRMIVGSIDLDPHDIRRKLEDHASRDAAAPGRDLNFALVVIAAGLVFLLFACDLIFSKW